MLRKQILKDGNCICKFENWIYYSENKNVQILRNKTGSER